MSLQLRPVLVVVALVVLNLGLARSHGLYKPTSAICTGIAFALGLTAALSRDRGPRAGRDAAAVVLGAAAVALSGVAIFFAEPTFDEVGWAVRWLPRIATMGFGLTVVACALCWLESARGGSTSVGLAVLVLIGAVLLGGFVLRILALHASPEPIVDVFNLLRDSADAILEGRNPYDSDYSSPYHTERSKLYDLYLPEHPRRVAGYPPLSYLLPAVPRLVGADVRWAHAALDAVAAACLFLIARRRGRPYTGLVAAALYLNMPRAPFLTEQAWTEPFLNGLLGLGFVLTEYSGAARRLGHICFGLALTAKQYGPVLLLPYAWAYRREWRMIALGLTAGVAVMLPWLIWSPVDFLDIVVFKHLNKTPAYHSVTFISAATDLFHKHPHPAWLWLACGPLLVLIARRAPTTGPEAALALGTALMTYVVFSTVGFYNYFLPVQYLWLIGVVGMLTTRAARDMRKAP